MSGLTTLSPGWRLWLTAVGLPAAVVAIDMLLLTWAEGRYWSIETASVVFVGFAIQIAVLSYAVGAFLSNWFWRIVVWTWSLVLLDLWLVGIWANRSTHRYQPADMLLHAMISSQISLCAVWVLLGTGTWQRRLPLVGVAVTAFALLGRYTTAFAQGWGILVLLGALATALLGAMLRVRGYRLLSAEPKSCKSPTDTGRRRVQFSLGEMAAWMTAAAVAMGMLRGLQSGLQSSMGVGVKWQATAFGVGINWQATAFGIIALCLAVVSLTAAWSALATHRGWLRLALLVIVSLGAGAAVKEMLDTVVVRPWSLVRTNADYMLHHLHAFGWWWVAWTALSGVFLAGLLLGLRAAGFRILRMVEPQAGSPH